MSFTLIKLYNQPTVNNVSQFGEFSSQLDVVELIRKYKDLVLSTPHRHETGLKYFVDGHDLFIGRENSNRKEEHLAGALFNTCQKGKQLPYKLSRNLGAHQFKVLLMEHHMAKYQRPQKQPSEPTNFFRRYVKQFPPALGPTILHNSWNGHNQDGRNNYKSRAIEVVHVRCQPL